MYIVTFYHVFIFLHYIVLNVYNLAIITNDLVHSWHIIYLKKIVNANKTTIYSHF